MARDPDIDDDVLAQLARLPVHDLDHQTSERIRRRAKASFQRHHRASQSTWLGALERLYWRIELVMVAGVSAVYLVMAFSMTLSLFR